jgi:hypothetical protein
MKILSYEQAILMVVAQNLVPSEWAFAINETMDGASEYFRGMVIALQGGGTSPEITRSADLFRERTRFVEGCCPICKHSLSLDPKDSKSWALSRVPLHEKCLYRVSAMWERRTFVRMVEAAFGPMCVSETENGYWSNIHDPISAKPWYWMYQGSNPLASHVAVLIGMRKHVISMSLRPRPDLRFEWWKEAVEHFASYRETQQIRADHILLHAREHEQMARNLMDLSLLMDR